MLHNKVKDTCCIMVALSFAVSCSNEFVAAIYALHQSNRYMNEEEIYPLQMIPVLSDVIQINYTMWTPMNWTSSHSIRRDDNYSSVPKIQYNTYLLSTTSSQSLQILVPLMSPNTSRTRTTTRMVVRRKNEVIRVEGNGVTSKPFMECTKRLGINQSRTEKADPKECYHRSKHLFLQRTTQQSKNHHCRYAMNGGPFNANGSPVGMVMVRNGTFYSKDFGPNIGFGIASKPTLLQQNGTNVERNDTNSSSSYWVMGRIHDIAHARALGIEQFVTGFYWLVYNYSNVALYRNNTTGANRASRSTIGITSDGILLLLLTDGCEHCFRHQGMTLTEVADLLLYFGAQYAINMDGGSSSVMVHTSHTILNQPTCYYNAIVPRKWVSCERPVSTVLCLS